MPWQNLLFVITIGLSAGVLAGGLRAFFRKKGYDMNDPRVQKVARFNKALYRFLSKAVYVVLGIGLVWALYFMVLGIADRSQNEYATNVSTLIVSVVTLFSIMIAYYEFTHRGDKR